MPLWQTTRCAKDVLEAALTDLTKRTLVAIILILLALWCLFSDVRFSVLMSLIALLLAFEYRTVARILCRDSLVRYVILLAVGGLVIVLMTIAMICIRYHPQGLIWTSWLLLSVWATDIAAYFTGKAFGKHRIAPSISPNKSWEGLAGGMLAAGMITTVFANYVGMNHPSYFIIGMGLACTAQAGDFLESFVKRKAGLKDSGTLLPGHGGVWDRIDGFIFVAPLAFLLHKLFPHFLGGLV